MQVILLTSRWNSALKPLLELYILYWKPKKTIKSPFKTDISQREYSNNMSIENILYLFLQKSALGNGCVYPKFGMLKHLKSVMFMQSFFLCLSSLFFPWNIGAISPYIKKKTQPAPFGSHPERQVFYSFPILSGHKWWVLPSLSDELLTLCI